MVTYIASELKATNTGTTHDSQRPFSFDTGCPKKGIRTKNPQTNPPDKNPLDKTPLAKTPWTNPPQKKLMNTKYILHK